jgi:hypothetical protein
LARNLLVRIANIGSEEFEEAHAGPLAGGGNKRRDKGRVWEALHNKRVAHLVGYGLHFRFLFEAALEILFAEALRGGKIVSCITLRSALSLSIIAETSLALSRR